jgi:LTXXQ motif family protein
LTLRKVALALAPYWNQIEEQERAMTKRMLIIAVAASLAATSGALAQMGRGGPMMGGGMMKQDCPMMGMMMPGQEGRLDQRLGALKTQLAIKPEQEAAWTAYVAAVKKNAEGMQGVHQTMRQSMQAKTPVERLDGHLAAVEGRANMLKTMKTALTPLYDALSAEQKTKANTVLGGQGCMM